MPNDELLVEILECRNKTKIGHITLNSPETLNSLTLNMVNEISYLRDLNEFVRVLKPFLIIIAVSYCDSDKFFKKMHSFFIYGAIFIILIGFMEFFDVPGYRKLISLIYTGHRFENLDRVRTILMAGDPNIAAALILYFVTYILQTMLMTKNKIRGIIFFILV